MKLSERLVLAFMNEVFKETNTSWYRGFWQWLIDSKYRKMKRLDLFLKDQLSNPDLVNVLREEVNNIPLRKNWDLQVMEVLRFVKKNYSYVYDKYNFGRDELWATADLIVGKKKDDCDGLNSLVYLLCRVMGVPSYLLWNLYGS